MNKENWTQYLQLGLELSLSVIIFLFIGYALDIFFNTKPFFTLGGVFFGLFSVFYILWKKFIKNEYK